MPKIYGIVAMWGYIISGSVGLLMSIITISLGVDYNSRLAKSLGMTLDTKFLHTCKKSGAGCFDMSAGIFFSVVGELYAIAVGVLIFYQR